MTDEQVIEEGFKDARLRYGIAMEDFMQCVYRSDALSNKLTTHDKLCSIKAEVHEFEYREYQERERTNRQLSEQARRDREIDRIKRDYRCPYKNESGFNALACMILAAAITILLFTIIPRL